MATLNELFPEKKKEKGVSLNSLFSEDKEEKGVSLKSLFSEDKKEETDVLKGSVIDGGNDYKKVQDEFKYSAWKDFKEQVIKRTYGGSARDLAQGTIDFTNYVAKKLPNVEENIIDLKLPTVEEPDYFGGQFSRDLLGFAVGFKGIDKAGNLLKIPKFKNKVLRSIQVLSKGGLAEQVAFSPYEKRLSNLVESSPTFRNPLTNYLKAVGTDSEDAARAKMFAEGAMLGIPFELLGYIGKGADNVKISAGAKLNEQTILDNIKPFSKENQDRINQSKNKLKEIDNIAKEQYKQTQSIKDKLGTKRT